MGERSARAHESVDEGFVLLKLGDGMSLAGRMVDLNLEGCCVHTREQLAAIPARQLTEVSFKVKGLPFCFGGVVKWTDDRDFVDVHFVDVTERRRNELAEALGEMEADLAKRTENASQLPAAVKAAPARQDSLAQEKPRNQGTKAAAPRERRKQVRLKVDNTAEICFVKTGSAIRGRIQDLSLDGCCIRADERFIVGIHTRVETEFSLRGLPFRMSGVIQAVHDRNTVGIRFLDVSERKREQVSELIGELQKMEEEDARKITVRDRNKPTL
jgi:hypothetical protein